MKTRNNAPETTAPKWKQAIYRLIFEADTVPGKTFDVVLLWTILLSVFIVMLESISEVKSLYGTIFIKLEWAFTILFTAEYLFRIISVAKPRKYIFSFYGVVDFLAIVPTYLSLFITGSHFLVVIRILRLLRVFRIFKLTQFLSQAEILLAALKASRPKIIVFLLTVFSIVIIIGSLIYVLEGPENGFNNIPLSIYWAIVTLTTVGYGDISPQTPLGQFFASIVMIIGYAIIAVPTGIVTVELAEASRKGKSRISVCPDCENKDNDADARFCKLCGMELLRQTKIRQESSQEIS